MNSQGIRAAGAAAACAALLATAGCGDSDESTTGSGDDAARAEFIAAADEICAQTTKELDAKAQKILGTGEAPKPEELRAVVREVSVPLLEEQYAQIGDLEPPAGDEEEIEAILAEAETAIATIEDDPKSMLVITGEPTPFDEVGRLQVDYGLTMCGGVQEEG